MNIVKRGKAAMSQLLLALAVSMVSFAAFATEPTPGAEITTLINTYKEEAVGLVLLMCLVLWTLKATGLLKPRG